MKHEEFHEQKVCLTAVDEAADEMVQLLRALPTLPAPMVHFARPHGWFQSVSLLWLLLLPLAAYLFQQWLASVISERTVLEATPYPYWRGLLSEVQHTLQAGVQLLQEVLG